MKEFLIIELDHFLEIADTINTPFKFIETGESDCGSDYSLVKATVWMRSAFLTFESDFKKEDLETIVKSLQRHGFTPAQIRETAYPIK